MSVTRRTNQEWLALYEQQRASGMTVKDWCAAKGIKLPTMADRITHLRKLGLIREPKPSRGKNSITDKKQEASKQSKKQKVDWMPLDMPAPSAITGKNPLPSLAAELPEKIEIQIKDCIICVNMPLEEVVQVIGRCML